MGLDGKNKTVDPGTLADILLNHSTCFFCTFCICQMGTVTTVFNFEGVCEDDMTSCMRSALKVSVRD